MSVETYSLIELEDLRRPMVAVVPVQQVHGSDWRDQAKCRDADDRDFFRSDGECYRPVPDRVRVAARYYCARCPVRDACGAEADALRDEGLRGGQWRFPDNKSSDRRYAKINLLEGL